MKESTLNGARIAVNECLEIKKGQQVLIISDKSTKPISQALHAACLETKAYPHHYLLKEKDRFLKKVPEDLKVLIKNIKKTAKKPAAFTAITAPSEETPFRIELLDNYLLAKPNPFRVGHMPGFTEEFMNVLSEPLNVMEKRAKLLEQILNWGEYVHIKTEIGTDLKLKIKDRKSITSIGKIIKQGKFGNVPSGEVFISPVENYGEGIFIIDGSTSFGLVEQPIRLTFKKGKIIEKVSYPSVSYIKYAKSVEVDKMAKVIGELGIGINSKAKVVGNMLIDEKAFKTCHIATGNNTSHGGKNNSKTHQDVLCKNPTIIVSKGDKEVLILKNGVIQKFKTP